LEAHAKENQVSFNQEVRTRLANSLEEKARRSLESLATNLEHKSRDIELATHRLEERLTFIGQAWATYQEAKSKTQSPQQKREKGGKA
jgi:hypothetical protein